MNLILAKNPVNLAAHARKLVTAHQAVKLGIASHVQKQHAKRLDEQRTMRANGELVKPVRRVAPPS